LSHRRHRGGTGPSAVTTATSTRNGLADLAVTATGSHAVAVLRGLGGGSFAAATLVPAGTSPQSIATGDWNQDGSPIWRWRTGCVDHLDHAGQGSGGVGNGTFGAAQAASAGGSPEALIAGEYNDDGRPDLAVAGGGVTGRLG
jgi:hypothetical protein